MIRLTVTEAMRLRVEPLDVGWDGEQNARAFEIEQPEKLNAYTCRVEIATAAGKSFHLVSDHTLPITSDIAVRGLNSIQFVYYDGDEIVRKSSVAQYRVGRSINAIDPGDPEFADGFAQLHAHAFVSVVVDEDTLRFFNFDGVQVGEVVIYPPAGIAISDGAGWAPSIPLHQMARTDVGQNFFGTNNVFHGHIQAATFRLAGEMVDIVEIERRIAALEATITELSATIRQRS